MYYECHITLYKEDIDKAKLMARDLGYKVSSIDGDPVLGDIVLGYITLKRGNYEDIYNAMEKICSKLSFPIIRKKIEHIVFDTKEG